MKWWMLLFLALPGCAHAGYAISDHYDGKKFHNADPAASGKGFLDVLKWQLGAAAAEWPEWVDDNRTPNFNRPFQRGDIALTFINHATNLVQLPGLNLITDPVFSERVSPVSWFGPKRHRAPGARIAELPKVGAVLLSHNHYDHLNLESLEELAKKDHPKFVVPLGNAKLLESAGLDDIVELDWWESVEIDGVKITLVPAQHWSSRGIFDRYDALWGGYVIEAAPVKIYFAGDTGYAAHFKAIAEKFGPMDLSLLPIGAYEPRWFMKDQHMNPDEAIAAHVDLQSKLSVGIHFGTFQLTDEAIDAPERALAEGMKKYPTADFRALKNGETILVRAGKVVP